MKARLTLSGIVCAGLLAGAGGSETCRELAATMVDDVTVANDNQNDADRVVELAICLDTSGSMDGLINAARQKLWSIVNDLALAEPTPKLRVALLTYGNDGHAPENGWVNVNVPFTEDLDKISEMLFALTTNGGTELVARVVQTATEELQWHQSTDALKMIVVAGNESADQDTEYSFRDICKQAISSGVMVNSIYCRYHGDGPEVEEGWREVARLADGQYASIDQNNTVPVIATPHDDALIELSTRLNGTYIPFGAQGEAGAANQWAQDGNALVMNKMAAASRAQTKGGALYACSWDLCDAIRMEQVKIEDVKEEDLPEFMREMSMDERKNHVEDMRAKRAAIQKEIESVTAARQTFLVAEQKRQATNGVDQFDLIIRSAIRDQARAKGFELPDPELDVAGTGGSMPYFVQIGTTWVAADLAGDFERAFAQGQPFDIAREVEDDSDAFTQLVDSLDAELRKALISIEDGRAILKHDGEVIAITLKPEPVEEGDSGLSNHATFQIMERQVEMIAQMNQPQAAGQHGAQQRAQTAQVAQTLQQGAYQGPSQTMQVNTLPAPLPPGQQARQAQQIDQQLISQLELVAVEAQQEDEEINALVEKYFEKRGNWWVDREILDQFDANGVPLEAVAFKPIVVGSEGYIDIVVELVKADEAKARAFRAVPGRVVVKMDAGRTWIEPRPQQGGSGLGAFNFEPINTPLPTTVQQARELGMINHFHPRGEFWVERTLIDEWDAGGANVLKTKLAPDVEVGWGTNEHHAWAARLGGDRSNASRMIVGSQLFEVDGKRILVTYIFHCRAEDFFINESGVWVHAEAIETFRARELVHNEATLGFPYAATFGDRRFEQVLATLDRPYADSIRDAFHNGRCGVRVLAKVDGHLKMFLDYRC